MTIYLGSDHAGFALKSKVEDFLISLGHQVFDLGAHEYISEDDYPDYIKKVAEKVSEKPHTVKGIVFGGTGQGEAMVANKYKNVRCTVFYGPKVAMGEVDIKRTTDHDPYVLLRLSREHNDANMLSLGTRFLTEAEAIHAINEWLSTSFKSDERHLRRINKF